MKNLALIQHYSRNRDVIGFAEDVLGLVHIREHAGQVRWAENSWRLINILKPANQWGKTLIEAVLHIYHAMCKPMLIGRVHDDKMWFDIRYETANVGKTYEVSKGVFETAIDLAEGKVLLKDGTTNDSMLKGWAIDHVESAPNKPPEIHWWNNSVTLIRSYDDFGSSFKRKRLAFVSVDETGDLPELKLFLNGTLIPRVFFFRGPIHLVGTSQPAGVEYEEVSEIAQTEYAKDPEKSEYYFQTGPVFENPNIDPDFLARMSAIADPELRKQIIYGQYVDYADHFFTFDEVNQVFSEPLPYDEETGITEPPDKTGHYVCVADMAATRDETAFTVIRHSRTVTSDTGKKTELPHKVVFHRAFRGDTMPLALQYEMIRNWFMLYKTVAPTTTKFVFDSVSLGGKNAEQEFSDLHGFPFPGTGSSYLTAKSEGLGTLKEVVSRGRRFVIDEKAQRVDENMLWGMLRISPKIVQMKRQFEAYKIDDKNIRTDRLMTIVMGVHYIEKRKPRQSHNRAVDFDIMGR